MTQVFPHGAIELQDLKQGNIFKVNGQCLKPYMDGIKDGELVEAVDLMELVYEPP